MLDPRIAGKNNIADVLQVQPIQVLRWCSTKRPRRSLTVRYRDPLRVRVLHGMLVIRKSRLDAWRNRNHRNGVGEDRVYGWKAICEKVGLRKSAAMKACDWAIDPLPVVRHQGMRVWAYVSALVEWREAHEHAYGMHLLIKARDGHLLRSAAKEAA